MLRKCVMIVISAGMVFSLLSAAEKNDTASSSAPIITQQNSDKTLAKQTHINPQPQSNWTKIKNLFM